MGVKNPKGSLTTRLGARKLKQLAKKITPQKRKLEERTKISDLKTKLLKRLEEIFETPFSVILDEEYNDVKEKFDQRVLSPIEFHEELQKMLSKIKS